MNEAERAELKRELRKMHEEKRPKKQGVNFYLLFLVALLLVALVAATFYFFWKYGDYTKAGKAKEQAVTQVRSQLDSCKSDLNKSVTGMKDLLGELNISSSSMESLQGLYTNLSNVKEQVEADLSNTQTSLSGCQTDLSTAQRDLNDAIEELNDYVVQYNIKVQQVKTLETRVSNLQTNVTALRSALRNLQDDYSDLQGDYEDLQDCVDANNCTAC